MGRRNRQLNIGQIQGPPPNTHTHWNVLPDHTQALLGTEKRQLKAIPPISVRVGTERGIERGFRRVPKICHHFDFFKLFHY